MALALIDVSGGAVRLYGTAQLYSWLIATPIQHTHSGRDTVVSVTPYVGLFSSVFVYTLCGTTISTLTFVMTDYSMATL